MIPSRPPGASTSQATGSPRSSWPSSSFTAIRSAWNVRFAGWPPANAAGAGIAETTVSTSCCVVRSGSSARRRTIARAMRLAKRSSPYSRSVRASRRSSQPLTRSAAVTSESGSMRMSSGAS